jgi:hypothetical protein
MILITVIAYSYSSLLGGFPPETVIENLSSMSHVRNLKTISFHFQAHAFIIVELAILWALIM